MNTHGTMVSAIAVAHTISKQSNLRPLLLAKQSIGMSAITAAHLCIRAEQDNLR